MVIIFLLALLEAIPASLTTAQERVFITEGYEANVDDYLMSLYV